MSAWKASPGHSADMLNPTHKVVAINFYCLAGFPYAYYGTTDFGGHVDPTAHPVGVPALSPGTARFDQIGLAAVHSWNRTRLLAVR